MEKSSATTEDEMTSFLARALSEPSLPFLSVWQSAELTMQTLENGAILCGTVIGSYWFLERLFQDQRLQVGSHLAESRDAAKDECLEAMRIWTTTIENSEPTSTVFNSP